jgi:hypothetical protein
MQRRRGLAELRTGRQNASRMFRLRTPQKVIERRIAKVNAAPIAIALRIVGLDTEVRTTRKGVAAVAVKASGVGPIEEQIHWSVLLGQQSDIPMNQQGTQRQAHRSPSEEQCATRFYVEDLRSIFESAYELRRRLLERWDLHSCHNRAFCRRPLCLECAPLKSLPLRPRCETQGSEASWDIVCFAGKMDQAVGDRAAPLLRPFDHYWREANLVRAFQLNILVKRCLKCHDIKA